MARYGITPFPPGLVVTGSIWILIVVYSFLYKIRIYPLMILFWIISFIYFCISKVVFSQNVDELLVSFFQYCTLGLFVSSVDFDAEKVTRLLCIFLLSIALPTYNLMQRDMIQTWRAVIDMDTCYAIIPILLGVMCRMIKYFKQTKWYHCISYILRV